MPESTFKLMTIGLLFIIVANTHGNPISAFSSYLLGSVFVVCGMWVWIEERKESRK